MMQRLSHTLLVLVVISPKYQADAVNETKLVLDDMAMRWDGKRYPERAYQAILDCLGKWDEPVIEAHDVAWRSFYEMYISLPAAQNEETMWSSSGGPFLETELKKTEVYGGNFNSFGTVEVRERCNYVSNIAYYNAALRICKYDDRWHSNSTFQSALMKSISMQAIGSAYFHGSFTKLGFFFDTENQGLSLYLAYQMSIQSVGEISDPNFNETAFRTGSNSLTLEDITPFWKPVDAITFLPLDEDLPFTEWANFIKDQKIPVLEENVLALVAWICVSTLPYDCCNQVVNDVVAPIFINDEEQLDFLRNIYFPQAKIAAESLDLPMPLWIGLPILTKGAGAAISFLWAYLFQENRLPTPGLEGMYFNTTALGAIATPYVDFFVNLLTGFGNPTKYIYKNKEEAYPGASFCNRDSPHSLWHQQSADAIAELAYLGDRLFKVLEDRKERMQHRSWFGSGVFDSFQNVRGGSRDGED
ncbi:expressed unknown protein [Seminavis robusta]|uniref:Uncharacterized protein n=1 Tax=Seminavis robusta TaxID=568900 RepID=A0A9N8HBJ5_9STRA|nr:expressed unknown protein [Seminavis robusta]|eukprot:Sro341_g121460.1 n/a (473) ;mRNA; r:39395-40891